MNRVELIGTYGGDLEHALSAWTSTSRDLTDEKRARVPALLRMLGVAGHHTPFEKSCLHFLIDAETASHIHLLKHRIGVSVNGESARYRELRQDRYHVPQDWPESWRSLLESHTARGQELYHSAIASLTGDFGFTKKRAKESARFFLGYNNVLTLDVMFNFRSFMHFVGLRGRDDAQDEIHWFSDEMVRLARETGRFEHSFAAFDPVGEVLTYEELDELRTFVERHDRLEWVSEGLRKKLGL